MAQVINEERFAQAVQLAAALLTAREGQQGGVREQDWIAVHVVAAYNALGIAREDLLDEEEGTG